jgi:hypothetical protein
VDADRPPTQLVALTRQLIFSLAEPALQPFLAAWPQPTEPALRSVRPSPLPVLQWLPSCAAEQHGFAASLSSCLLAAAPALAWRQTYTVAELGADFVNGYGYTEIVGTKGPLASAAIACGFLLLGPATLYPRHRHEAEEIYVVLSGHAQWQGGDGLWQQRTPGTIIHHVSEEPHAMRTGDQPLLALYLWRSANLNQKARLEPIEAAAV